MADNLPWSEQFRVVAKAAFETRFIPEPNSGCWLWIGPLQVGKEYGLFSHAGKTFRAHRASYRLYVGHFPDTKVILHKCDNPACVNPEHLLVGSQAENIADRHSKGRSRGPRGEKAPLAKLSVEQVRAIKLSRLDSTRLGAEYGVSRQTIHKIRTGKIWQDV